MEKLSPIDMMIDAACGANKPAAPRNLTAEEREMCSQLGRDVLSDLRYAYPDVVKTGPTTWPIHLRNTISQKAEMMLMSHLGRDSPLTQPHTAAGRLALRNLPTSDPGEPGALWSDAGTLKISP